MVTHSSRGCLLSLCVSTCQRGPDGPLSLGRSQPGIILWEKRGEGGGRKWLSGWLGREEW